MLADGRRSLGLGAAIAVVRRFVALMPCALVLIRGFSRAMRLAKAGHTAVSAKMRAYGNRTQQEA